MARFDYLKGDRMLIPVPLDSVSAATVVGLAITASGATVGYFKEVDAVNEAVVGIAVEIVASPSTDGGASVLIDISESSVYLVAPDAGSVTAALAMSTADVGANGLSVDINGSTTDDIEILTVDVAANTMLVRLKRALPGVV
jgi:hypothetical protein